MDDKGKKKKLKDKDILDGIFELLTYRRLQLRSMNTNKPLPTTKPVITTPDSTDVKEQ